MAVEIVLDEQRDQSLDSGDVDSHDISFGSQIDVDVSAGEATILFEDHNGNLLTGTRTIDSSDNAFTYNFHLMRDESRHRERPSKVLISGTQDSTTYTYVRLRSE